MKGILGFVLLAIWHSLLGFFRWLACRIVGHRWKFLCINDEGEKAFVCRRCGKEFYVLHVPQRRKKRKY